MDKVKEILGHLKRFHFWILCGVIGLVGLGSWYVTKASLYDEFTANKGEIEGGYSTVSSVRSTPNPPNPKIHQAMEERVRALQANVAAVWQAQYEHQKNTILTWPSGPDELTPQFIRAVEPLRPIETSVPAPAPGQSELLSSDLRYMYANYVEAELPKLAKIIGAQWGATAPSGRGGFAAGYGGEAAYDSTASYAAGAEGYGSGRPRPRQEFVVDWSTADQSQLLGKFTWTGQRDSLPTTLQVLYAQEDLWVLKNVMEIINRTNDGATERHKASIKRIDSIQIGREAAGRRGQITPIAAMGQGTMTGEGMMPADAGMPADGGGGEGLAMPADGMMGEGTAMPGMAVTPDPAAFRYVDKDYKPLPADKLRSDVTTNPAEVYLAVAKRMPVRMVCHMDQRKIHKLLVECGNSPLTVEVRQVRIGGSAGQGGGSFRGGGFASNRGFGFDAALGGEGAAAGFGGFGTTRGVAPQAKNDVMVEIYGIVYIYNPVNNKALGIDESQVAETLTASLGPTSR